MNDPSSLMLACIGGPTLIFGASDGLAQSSSDPHCIVIARGTRPDGDEFFAHATINMDFSASPWGQWRHFVAGSSDSAEEAFVGRIENGIGIRNGRTFIWLFGVGRYTRRPVEFECFGHDGSTDSYLLIIRDDDGNVVHSALGDLANGDISAAFP
jgi:hypothetical protein